VPDGVRAFDYVVVGGGTAGCIVAARLAEDPGTRVCLIEEGPAFEEDPLVLGSHSSAPFFGNPRYGRDYAIVSQERGNSSIVFPRARMLGGCSSHNDAVAVLPPAADFDDWVGLGAAGWDLEANMPAFRRAMEATGTHRAPGDSACARAMHAAALELGLPERELDGTDLGEGAFWLHHNARDGRRQSSAVAYLYPLRELCANLVLLLETDVRRILFDDAGNACAVQTSSGTIHARREIIVCAGAIVTPQLLMLSGIGPAEDLRRAGIDVIHDAPAVGEHLQDHLELPVLFAANRPTEPACPSSENAFACQSGIDPGDDRFDLFFHGLPQPSYSVGHGFSIAPNVARPASSGRLRLDPGDPAGPPLIDPRYLTDSGDRDEEALCRGVGLVRTLAEQTSLRDWISTEILPGPGVEDPHLVRRHVHRAAKTVQHPVGTCRMAGDDAVVDPALRVRGVNGLRVADASVFPTITSVNPCLTVMMVAERCAEMVETA
jgi:choline dehydrogenase-like flavoprotein